MSATFFYPGFLCQLSPTASFVCKKKTNKQKQSVLQPTKNARKAHKGHDMY